MKINWMLVLKVVAGMVVIPVCVSAMYLWPWWQKKTLWTRIFTSPFIIPVTVLAFVFSFWYDGI